MPQALPLHVFLKGTFNRGVSLLKAFFRNMLVTFIWSIVTPYTTYQIWKFYFPQFDEMEASIPRFVTEFLPTEFSFGGIRYFTKLETVLALRYFVYECFLGIFICVAVLLGFLSLFILRDFIMTNAVLNEVDVDMERLNEEAEEEPEPEIADLRDSFERYEPRTRRRTNESILRRQEHPAYAMSTTNYSDIDSTEFVTNLQLNEIEPGSSNGTIGNVNVLSLKGKEKVEEEEEIPDVPTPAPLPLYSQHVSEMNTRIAANDFESSNRNFQEFLERQRQDQRILNELRQDLLEQEERPLAVEMENPPAVEVPQEITLVEMVGLKGPIYYLFQNFVIVIFVLSFVIGTFIYIPYLSGSLIFATSFGAEHVYNVIVKPWEPILAVGVKFALGEIAYEKVGIQVTQILNLFNNLSFSSYKSACIVAGYCFLLSVIYGYVRLMETVNEKNSGAISKFTLKVLKFTLVFFKITFLIFVELVIFPILCGFLINLCTLRLLNSTLLERITYIVDYTVLATALHWITGSLFMFQFANFVTSSREILRPGLLFFIRNPNDPNYHPMKEMVEKPLFYQIKRVIASAIIYSFIIFMLFGVSLQVTHTVFPSLFPLSISISSTTAVMEIVLLNSFIPFLFNQVEGGEKLKAGYSYFLSRVCHFLGISSYYFGGRYLKEEGIKGKFVFVPSFDHVYKSEERLPIVNSVVCETDLMRYGLENTKNEENVEALPLGTTRKTTVNRFNQPDILPLDLKDFHSIDHRYTIVYRPNMFRLRTVTFLIILWSAVSVCLFAAFFLPFIVGRGLFQLVNVEKYSDLYTFQLGFHALWILAAIGYSTLKAVMKVHSFNIDQIIVKVGVFAKIASKLLFASLWLGLVFPMLVGFYVDWVFVMPLRVKVNETMVVEFLHEWCLGLMVMRIMMHILDKAAGPTNKYRVAITRLTEGGLCRIDMKNLVQNLVMPGLGFFGIVLGFPFILSKIVINTWSNARNKI
jgi:E3 ubiquitin-protein ligase DOA10